MYFWHNKVFPKIIEVFQPKKIKIYKTSLPKASVLSHSKTNYDFVDSFQGLFHDTRNTITSTVVAKAFFSSGPRWVENLLILRNKMVGVIGLKTSDAIKNKEKILENFQLEPGQQIGLFTVFTKTKNEVVLGENDKHLDFRISLFLEDYNENNKKLIVSTTVIINNWLGHLYFIPVKPFHKIVVPAILKSTIKELNKS